MLHREILDHERRKGLAGAISTNPSRRRAGGESQRISTVMA
jgi:hypothetical protein